MKPTFVKKNTAGGAAGLDWAAGEIKEINSYLADELVKLAPEDYEVVEAPETTDPISDGETDSDPEPEDAEKESEEVKAEKPKAPVGRPRKKTETPSAE